MVFSYYVARLFYPALWHLHRLLRRGTLVVLYCDDPFDLTLFENVGKHLKKIPVVAKNRKVKQKLEERGWCGVLLMPVFPDGVIMFRNMAWKFPCSRIVKIGFEHGAYNFKKFSKAQYYNMFTAFFMTSRHDVERVRRLGVVTAEAVGFPKIDSAFDGSITKGRLAEISAGLGLDPGKKTLLFSSTWDGSGMSAVHLWYDRVGELADTYNILATLHPWVSDSYRTALRTDDRVHFIEDDLLLPYIMVADICIGDTNSLIAEFCLLDKPIITFRRAATGRTLADVVELIEKVSLRIDRFEEVAPAVSDLVANPARHDAARREAVAIFFDAPDGRSGERAAQRIIELIPQVAP